MNASTFFDIALRVINGIIKSEAATSIARYAIRQATAAVVREIRKRTSTQRRGPMQVS